MSGSEESVAQNFGTRRITDEDTVIVMKINILTSVHKGGPYNWGRDLAYLLNKKGFIANHVHKLKEVLISPFYQDADIIHATLPLTYKLWRKSVVLTVKGDYSIEKRKWRLFYPIAIKKADVITTPSYFLKERLNLDDAVVIPNAIFPNQFKVVKHSEKDVINLVTVTKFAFKDKSEGVLNMIKILEKVQKSTNKNINYTIIGGGPYLEQIKEKTRGYNMKVKFTGFLDNPKEVLEASDIFVYYSIHDNFPNAILEAMASGLPVVTNNVGAVHEIIKSGKDGKVAECDEDYQKYLLNLVDDYKLRVKMGQNTRKTVEEKFDWNIIVNDYICIYEKLSGVS